jgi:hypothetical protein
LKHCLRFLFVGWSFIRNKVKILVFENKKLNRNNSFWN